MLSVPLASGMLTAAAAAQLNPQQIELIEQTAASICDTVKDARGQKSASQIKGDVKAQLGGIVGKIADLAGSAGGKLTREEFDGLSQDATATALEGDRGCRERVFNKMFEKLSFDQPEQRDQTASCVVDDPTGTSLNVRATPNGGIKQKLANGNRVTVLKTATASNGKSWVYVADSSGQEVGWVFLPYLSGQHL